MKLPRMEVARRGVPVIAFNVDDSRTPNARLAAVGQNMLAAGRKFGRQVAPSIAQGGHILLTMHDPNISALEDRAQGIRRSFDASQIVDPFAAFYFYRQMVRITSEPSIFVTMPQARLVEVGISKPWCSAHPMVADGLLYRSEAKACSRMK